VPAITNPKALASLRRRAPRGQVGAAAVEMALVLPLLFLLIFGIIEFGFIFNRYITVTHAAREGVRVYALPGKTAADGVAAAQSSAPDLGGEVKCSASPGTPEAGAPVQMKCSSDYDLQLYIFDRVVTVDSTAQMSRE
jgi:Flp pilus assembly protein TadG